MTNRSIKVVSKGKNRGDVDVYDLETGSKISGVYSVHVDISKGVNRVTIETADPFVYEGPAGLVDPTLESLLGAVREVVERRIVSFDGEEQMALYNLSIKFQEYTMLRKLAELTREE